MLRSPLAHLGLVLLLSAAGCSEGGLLTEPVHPGDPLRAISDGSHDGVEGFYFLPPMVKTPDHAGTFDPTLSPVVEICETTACTEFHEIFSMTEGAGSELVRLDEENEHYVVNWHTDRTGPDGTGTAVGQTYRVRIQVAGTVLGYADVQMAENGKEARNTTTDNVIGLVDGRTLPVMFRIETGIPGAVVVSPAEATIDVGGTQQFTAALQDLHGEPLVGPTVTWSSGDAGVATVNADGLATGEAEGAATITATAGPASGHGTLGVTTVLYDAVGNWKMDLTAGADVFPRFVIISTHTDGEIAGFIGGGYDPDGAVTGTITGTISGKVVAMNYDRTGYDDPDYKAWFEGTIAHDGNSMSGTWTDNRSYASPQQWSMARQ